MNKTKRMLVLAAGVGLCCIAVWADQPNLTTQTISCGSEFISPHELRGITTIRLEVDGFPTPVEGSDISEVTLAGQLKSQLSKAGLTVAVEYLPDAPTLHIRVLYVLAQPRRADFLSTGADRGRILRNPTRIILLSARGCD